MAGQKNVNNLLQWHRTQRFSTLLRDREQYLMQFGYKISNANFVEWDPRSDGVPTFEERGVTICSWHKCCEQWSHFASLWSPELETVVGTSLKTSLTVMRLRSLHDRRWNGGTNACEFRNRRVQQLDQPELTWKHMPRSHNGYLLFNVIVAFPRNDPTDPRAACLNAHIVFGNTVFVR